MRKILLVVAALGGAAGSTVAWSDDYTPYYQAPWSSFDFLTDQRWSQINNRLIDQNIEIMNDSVKADQEKRAEANKAALDLGPAATTDLTPLRPYLEHEQLTEEQAAKLLVMYAQAAERLDVPANDSASGIAAFLAGTYAAYTNKPFPDDDFRPLYRQFESVLASDESLQEKTQAERIEYYQRLVVVGMVFQLMQLDLAEKPDPAQVKTMQEAAGKAFHDLAGLSPADVSFTKDGMTVVK